MAEKKQKPKAKDLIIEPESQNLFIAEDSKIKVSDTQIITPEKTIDTGKSKPIIEDDNNSLFCL